MPCAWAHLLLRLAGSGSGSGCHLRGGLLLGGGPLEGREQRESGKASVRGTGDNAYEAEVVSGLEARWGVLSVPSALHAQRFACDGEAAAASAGRKGTRA